MIGYQIVIILCCFTVYVYSKITIMVVLGCAMENVQQERVSTALEYVADLDDSDTTWWFVTGGVKNAVVAMEKEKEKEKEAETEAKKMEENIGARSNGKIVLDEKAKNTAENFAYLKKWVLETFDEIPEIVITTSEFHKERASKIFSGIFQNTDPLWNLSRSNNCAHCWNDEKIHMRNVVNDVKNAQYILERA